MKVIHRSVSTRHIIHFVSVVRSCVRIEIEMKLLFTTVGGALGAAVAERYPLRFGQCDTHRCHAGEYEDIPSIGQQPIVVRRKVRSVFSDGSKWLDALLCHQNRLRIYRIRRRRDVVFVGATSSPNTFICVARHSPSCFVWLLIALVAISPISLSSWRNILSE